MTEDDKRFAFEDAFSMLCGDLIASGMSRHVYECAILPGHVVKVEARPFFQNVQEDAIWNAARSVPAVSRWLAPVKWISPYGRVMVMERTMPVAKDDLPARVPAFLTDTKVANWGRLGGRIVCHDYGTHLAFERGMSKAMRRAEWYEG